MTRHPGDEVVLISFLVGLTSIPSSEPLLTLTLEPCSRYLTAVTRSYVRPPVQSTSLVLTGYETSHLPRRIRVAQESNHSPDREARMAKS